MEYSKERIDAAVAVGGKSLRNNDAAFFQRIWQTPTDLYKSRLQAIGFSGAEKVLDAGSGFGQWTLALTSLNQHVEAVEIDEVRVKVSTEIFTELNVNNITIRQGSIEKLPFDDNAFDLVFSYSVIFCADYRKALKEYYRILKPGGKLYFNTNGLGWYLYNMLEGHNETTGFSPKQMAISAINTTIKYYAEGVTTPGTCIITPKSIVINDLMEYGYKNILIDDEGKINLNPEIKIKPFFMGEYCGEEGIYEIIAVK